MGDFSINILQYNNNKGSQEYLDKMHSNFILPYISSDYYARFLLLKDNNLTEGQNQILKLSLGNTNDSFEILFETFNKIIINLLL